MKLNERYRALRGLVIHYRRGKAQNAELKRLYRRQYDWSPAFGSYYSRGCIYGDTVLNNKFPPGPDGLPDRRCCWCEMPLPIGRARWCGDGCVRAYSMACGRQRMADGRYVIDNEDVVNNTRHHCVGCGRGPTKHRRQSKWDEDRWWDEWEVFELDHIVALSIAWERKDERQWVRAHLPENLQWLCRDCHKHKTANDRRILSNIQNNRPEYWIKPEYIKGRKETRHNDQLTLI